VRKTIAYSGSKGDASESVWIDLLDQYRPKRYQVAKAHVVDSNGIFSEQSMWRFSAGSTYEKLVASYGRSWPS